MIHKHIIPLWVAHPCTEYYKHYPSNSKRFSSCLSCSFAPWHRQISMAASSQQTFKSEGKNPKKAVSEKRESKKTKDIVCHKSYLDTDITITKHVETLRTLINKEKQAETVQVQTKLKLASSKSPLANLIVTDEDVGPGDLAIWTLEYTGNMSNPSATKADLSTFPVTVGSIVQISPKKPAQMPSSDAPKSVTGTLYRVTRDKIMVAVDSGEDPPETAVRLDILTNTVTYDRMAHALDLISQRITKVGEHMFGDVIFHAKRPSVKSEISASQIFDQGWSDPSMNEAQRTIIQLAVQSDLAVLWGPCGTGKSRTLVNAMIAAVKVRNEKVLAVASSNIAVDSLVEKLAETNANIRFVRIGNPIRLLDSVLEHSLDVQIEREFRSIASDIRRDIEACIRKLRSSRLTRAARIQLRSELRMLRAEMRTREKEISRRILISADIVLATCTASADPCLNGIFFDALFLDEAAQALEPLAWLGIMRAGNPRVILCGDNNQLPPTTYADHSGTMKHLDLFSRTREITKDEFTVLLSEQYRMNQVIMQWSSETFYAGKLFANDLVKTHRLADLKHIFTSSNVEPSDDATNTLVFIDTAGCDLAEQTTEDENDEEFSRFNEGEARIVLEYISRLTALGIPHACISVLSPYAGQVRRLRQLVPYGSAMEIGTVDSYQGRESEAVIVTLVRSNEDKQVGFLSDFRRLNVAITRARRQVCVIGDSGCISSDKYLASFIEYAEKHGTYRSAWEFM